MMTLWIIAIGIVVTQLGLLAVLVAATIIKTIIVEPSFESLGLLAGMIVIRTILGWTTALEINRRWPWQKGRREAAPSRAES